jgi:DNA-binding MarR family transcriptional regulator
VRRTDPVLGTPVEVLTRRVFTNVIRTLSAFLAQGEFTISEVAALHVIGQGEGLSVQGLSQELKLSVSATSRVISSLVDKGLVLRRAGDGDARVKVLSCTKAGTNLLDRMSLERVAAIFEVAESLPPAMSEQIFATMARFQNEKER